MAEKDEKFGEYKTVKIFLSQLFIDDRFKTGPWETKFNNDDENNTNKKKFLGQIIGWALNKYKGQKIKINIKLDDSFSFKKRLKIKPNTFSSMSGDKFSDNNELKNHGAKITEDGTFHFVTHPQ